MQKGREILDFEHLAEKHITLTKGDVTPKMEEETYITFGTSPENGDVYGSLKLEAAELVGELSRNAIEIAYLKEKGVRVRSLTANNKITVWSVDQKQPYSAELRKDFPIGEANWQKLGRHINIDIETASGPHVRLKNAGDQGEFRVQILPSLQKRSAYTAEEFHKIQPLKR